MNYPDLQALIEKYGAPAFAAAQRQVWVDFWTCIGGAVIALLILAVLLGVANYFARLVAKGEGPLDNDWDITMWISRAAALGPALLAVIFAISAIRIWANPEWYAIQTLASLLPGNKS